MLTEELMGINKVYTFDSDNSCLQINLTLHEELQMWNNS